MKITDYIDYWSLVVLILTALLFIGALFFKGFTHDLLLETGVFLVSVKIIMMIYRNNLNYRDVKKDLGEIKQILSEKKH
ncbi:MAG: hypothetical protein GYA43_12640 [Bacteroidales bacterium]|nr:hypothetical protein [Bacteroidales bacterium]